MPATMKSATARRMWFGEVTTTALLAPMSRSSRVLNSAFCTVDPARFSTWMRAAGRPRPTSQLRIASASVMPFCGFPPVTTTGEKGEAIAWIQAAVSRLTSSGRSEPSGSRP
ncbi:Uncharacterised protein [Mycobacteroides abscessus subsp. abscessus]|nr:Uncharacterised protein [Mycobacteroides abscessus subsp. abscessus]